MRRRTGFTLVELLIVCAILAIMAAMVIFAMFGAQEAAKQRKTEALIARIDAILKYKWESYRTRRVNIDTTGLTPPQAAKRRLDALRELMRMELPDRWSDIVQVNYSGGNYTVTNTRVANVTALPDPAVWVSYFRRTTGSANLPTMDYQGAECLYMILRAQVQEDGDDISIILKPENIGDKDEDGFPEIKDAWGNPIRFLRWAPGFLSELQVAAQGTVSSEQTNPPRPTLPSSPPSMMFDVLVDYGTNAVPYGEVISPGLATTQSAYVGGAVVMLNPATREPEFDKMARITGYQYFPLQTSPSFRPAFARFTCATATYTTMQPFAPSGGGAVGAKFVVLPQDPFDPTHVYPIYPNPGNSFPPNTPKTDTPTFDLYPLVYSAGADKQYGIASDVQPGSSGLDPLSYANLQHNVANPFYRPASYKLMGYQESDGTWKDNIHNHMMGLR